MKKGYHGTTLIYTFIFRKGDDWRGTQQQRIHLQPLSDFMGWITSKGELNYLPYELKISLPPGKWDSVPGCYLPSHCLDVAYVLLEKPKGTFLRCLSLLAWVTEDAVFEKKEKEARKAIQDAIKCEQWKEHRLYAQGEKHRTLWYEIRKCSEVGISIKWRRYKGVAKVAKGNRKTKPQLTAVDC